MATCELCGKKTVFGHNRSFSLRATNRKFEANIQKVSIFEEGKKVRKTVCTRCLRTLAKS